MVIHGGFWKAQYDLTLGEPLAADLVAQGWAALNVEYRRVGNGGGVPATLDDVRAAIDLVAGDYGTVVTLGHSAGGHLATWAGSQVDTVTHVISRPACWTWSPPIARGSAPARCGRSSATPRSTPPSTRCSSCRSPYRSGACTAPTT